MLDEEGGGALFPDREVPRSCSCLSIYDLEHESNQNSPKMCCSSIILLYIVQYKNWVSLIFFKKYYNSPFSEIKILFHQNDWILQMFLMFFFGFNTLAPNCLCLEHNNHLIQILEWSHKNYSLSFKRSFWKVHKLYEMYSGYGKYSDPLTFFTLCYIAAIC